MIHENIRQSSTEHPFAQYVRILGKGKKGSRSFTQEEAQAAMSMILNGEVEDLQLGAFLMLLRVKEETPNELAGFVQAVKDIADGPSTIHVDLDWSSYAGKRRHLPWYIFSILLLADAGKRIFMHGASGHTANRLYTENILEELGLPIARNWQDAESQLNESNFSYMPLRNINARLAEIIDMRNTLGLRSPVHSLSRLINPLNADNVLQGIFHPPYAGMHQEAGAILGYKNLLVIKGEGGEIERNPDNELTAFSAQNGELNETHWPALFKRRHVKASDMSSNYMRKIWQSEEEDEYAVGAIVGTTALGLVACDTSLDQDTSMSQARALWENRKAHKFS